MSKVIVIDKCSICPNTDHKGLKVNKTTEALNASFSLLNLIRRDKAWDTDIVDAVLENIREALAESKPAPDGRIPKTVFALEDIGKAFEDGRKSMRCEMEALAEPDTKSGELHAMKTELWKAEHSGDANEMVADTNPLSVFAKECVLGAYTYDELPEAARLALKRAKKPSP